MNETAIRLQRTANPDHRGRFVDDYLLYLLASVSSAASEEFYRTVREAGLKPPEWRLLGSLDGDDGAPVTRLAALALMEQSRMTRLVERMEARGFVRREADAEDRRRVRVFYTEEGRALAARLIVAARAHEARILGLLSAPEAARLKALLEKLNDRIGRAGQLNRD
ncbi:MAG: MarR family winged helix-turn-helix transcriptional regulator [Gemmobacter sp.]